MSQQVGGMGVSLMKRFKELETKNIRLKKMHVEEQLKKAILFNKKATPNGNSL